MLVYVHIVGRGSPCFRNLQLVERLRVKWSHHSKPFHISCESAQRLMKATSNNITPNGEVTMKLYKCQNRLKHHFRNLKAGKTSPATKLLRLCQGSWRDEITESQARAVDEQFFGTSLRTVATNKIGSYRC